MHPNTACAPTYCEQQGAVHLVDERHKDGAGDPTNEEWYGGVLVDDLVNVNHPSVVI